MKNKKNFIFSSEKIDEEIKNYKKLGKILYYSFKKIKPGKYKEEMDLGYETELKSDVAPVWGMVEAAKEVGTITAMKDPTRGGIANALNEMATKASVGMYLDEERIPVKPEVEAVSDMLGIDPFEVANEGKVVMGVKPDKAEEVLEAIKGEKYGE